MAVLSVSAYPQTLHAIVRGRVVEKSGAVMPKVQIRAVNEETNDVRQTLSGEDGEFVLSLLPPGAYRIEAILAGYQKHVSTGIQLRSARICA